MSDGNGQRGNWHDMLELRELALLGFITAIVLEYMDHEAKPIEPAELKKRLDEGWK